MELDRFGRRIDIPPVSFPKGEIPEDAVSQAAHQLMRENIRANGKRLLTWLEAETMAQTQQDGDALVLLSYRLLSIAEDLAEQERIAAMRARYAGPDGWIKVPVSPEAIAIRHRLVSGLVAEAHEVLAAIQQVIGGQQADQMDSPVQA